VIERMTVDDRRRLQRFARPRVTDTALRDYVCNDFSRKNFEKSIDIF
jgi:hypothetical protein